MLSPLRTAARSPLQLWLLQEEVQVLAEAMIVAGAAQPRGSQLQQTLAGLWSTAGELLHCHTPMGVAKAETDGP